MLAQGYRRYYSYCDNEFVENTYSKAKFLELVENGALDFKADKIYEKNFSTTIRIKSLIVNKKYKAIVNNEEVEYQIDVKTTSAGTELKSIFNTAKPVFSNPKNVNYIKLLISLMPSKDLIVLDFFAGSGTTAQAVMELNKLDGGNRKFILCTNNESSIYQIIHKFLVDKYKLTGNKQDNRLRLEGAGYKFDEVILGQVREGKFVKTDSILDDKAGTFRQTTRTVNTHAHGIELLHSVDVIKSAIGMTTQKATDFCYKVC